MRKFGCSLCQIAHRSGALLLKLPVQHDLSNAASERGDARACTHKGADVGFWGLSRNFLLNQSIADFNVIAD